MLALEERLGYSFKDSSLLRRALTHPSYGAENNQPDYQRLEFLGDAVLELAISDQLYRRYTHIAEGQLTRARASLVCEDSLFRAANGLGLGAFVQLSAGEEKTGGRGKPSILSDVMEAVIGAVYLDSGMEEAAALVLRILESSLAVEPERDELDAKSQLQMIAQRETGHTPVYEMASQSGEDHCPVFTMRVTLAGEALAEGSGRSKREAAQKAARIALERFEKQ